MENNIYVLTEEEFNFINNINQDNYLVNEINKENDIIYKKFLELNIVGDVEKIKTIIKNTVNNFIIDYDSIELDNFIFCIQTNFIRILKEQGKLDELSNIIMECGLYSFINNEDYIQTFIVSIGYIIGKNYNIFEKKEYILNCLNELIAYNNENIVLYFFHGFFFGK